MIRKIRLTETDITRIVRNVLNEAEDSSFVDKIYKGCQGACKGVLVNGQGVDIAPQYKEFKDGNTIFIKGHLNGDILSRHTGIYHCNTGKIDLDTWSADEPFGVGKGLNVPNFVSLLSYSNWKDKDGKQYQMKFNKPIVGTVTQKGKNKLKSLCTKYD
jgi:hypothetical protein